MTTAISDAAHLARRFTLPQLRTEKHIAEVNTHPDCDDYNYWLWFGLVVGEAIDMKKLSTPKTTTKHNNKRIDVEAVKSRADIVTLAEGYGLRLHKSGRNFKAICPFHNEKTPSFNLYPGNNRFHCYGCQADGDVISFVMRMDGIDFRTAAAKVGG